MPLEDSTSRAQYETNGTIGPFAVPFYFLASAHLEVVYTDAAGAAQTLDLDVDYSVSGARVESGGSVTLTTAYAAGGTITILRNVPLTQLTDFEDADAFPASATEDGLDKLTMIAQQQDERLGRALMVAPGDVVLGALPGSAELAGRMLGFDTSGAPEPTAFTQAQVAAVIAASAVTGISAGHILGVETQTITAGATVITLGSLTYTPGTSSVLLVADGLVLRPGSEFLETSSSSLTLAEAFVADTEVMVLVGRLVTSGMESTQVSHILPGGSGRSQADINDELLAPATEGGLEVIAHRGFRDQFPQNTLLSMSMALTRGADSLECDVQITSDSVPILFHDATLDALTSGTGAVSTQTLAYVQGLTFDEVAGTALANLRIPTFASLLAYAKERGVFVYPEIKEYRTAADIALIVDAIEDAEMDELCMLTSFTYSDVVAVRILNTRIKVGFVGASYVTDYEAQIDALATLGRAAIVWDYTDLVSRPAIVSYAFAAGVDVVAYTIDSLQQARSVTILGVRKLIADTALGL